MEVITRINGPKVSTVKSTQYLAQHLLITESTSDVLHTPFRLLHNQTGGQYVTVVDTLG